MSKRPVGINLCSITYAKPCPFIEQTLCGQAGRPSNSTQTMMVPLASQMTNWTLVTAETVKTLKVGGVSMPIAKGRATFDAKGIPGHGTVIALGTTVDVPISIVPTSCVGLKEQGKRWLPTFLAAMAGSPGFRMMDWARTNDTTMTAWTPDNALTYNGVAVPIVPQVDLCNETGADMWMNIPPSLSLMEAVRAVRQARALLFPWLMLHVEWANEVWNTDFAIAKLAAAYPAGAAAYYGQHVAPLAVALKDLQGIDIVLAWQHMSSATAKQKVLDAYIAAGGPRSMLRSFATALYAWNETDKVANFLAKNDVAGLDASLEANRAARAAKTMETVTWARSQGLNAVFYETGLGPNTFGTDQAAFGALATQTVEGGAIFERMLADGDAAGVMERYAYNSAASGEFGFFPDYDAAPYPIGAVWQLHNRQAWPLMRAH